MESPTSCRSPPITSTIRASGIEVVIEPDAGNGLRVRSVAQCQHVRSVAVTRVRGRVGNLRAVVLL